MRFGGRLLSEGLPTPRAGVGRVFCRPRGLAQSNS